MREKITKMVAEYYLLSLRGGGLSFNHVQTNRISQEQSNKCESRLNPSDLFAVMGKRLIRRQQYSRLYILVISYTSTAVFQTSFLISTLHHAIIDTLVPQAIFLHE